MGARIDIKSKLREKRQQEIDVRICYFLKGFKNIKKTVEGAILSLNGSKDYRVAGWFQGPGSQRAAPKYAHVTKEEKGPPKERKYQRKKG